MRFLPRPRTSALSPGFAVGRLERPEEKGTGPLKQGSSPLFFRPLLPLGTERLEQLSGEVLCVLDVALGVAARDDPVGDDDRLFEPVRPRRRGFAVRKVFM